MERNESLPLGVVLEWKKVEHRWKDHDWRPVAVVPGAGPLDPTGDWLELRSGEGWKHYHCGTLTLELFRKETEGYRLNLSQKPPRIFVVLRTDDDGETGHDVLPFLVTACPYEAQDYLDSGEEIVEAVTMPDAVIAFVQAFIDEHHVDEPFKKRKRLPHDPRKEGFARNGPAPQRMTRASGGRRDT